MSSSKKNNHIKCEQLITQLNKLLQACRAPDNMKPTHVSIAHPVGKYLITSKEDKKQFNKLYTKGITLGCKFALYIDMNDIKSLEYNICQEQFSTKYKATLHTQYYDYWNLNAI